MVRLGSLWYEQGKLLFPTPQLPSPGRVCPVPVRTSCRGSQAPAFCLCHLFSDKNNYKELLGAVDNAFLVAYAIGMFIR